MNLDPRENSAVMSVLADALEKQLLEQGPEDEVDFAIDLTQSTTEEKHALSELVLHIIRLKKEGEWMEIAPEADGIKFGDHDGSLEYLHWWDEHEMARDMEIFEEEFSLDTALSIPHKDRPNSPSDGVFDQRDTSNVPVKLLHLGDDYYTGQSPFGKVYIPRHFADRVRGIVETRWNKSGGTSGTPALNAPWMGEIQMNVRVMGPHCNLPLRCNHIIATQ
jgi:hypothetical protein